MVKDTAQGTRIEAMEAGEKDEDAEEVKILQEIGSFDEVVLWGHESMVEGDDAFVKGLGEWIGFAEAVWTPFPTPRAFCDFAMLTEGIVAQARTGEKRSGQREAAVTTDSPRINSDNQPRRLSKFSNEETLRLQCAKVYIKRWKILIRSRAARWNLSILER